MVYAKELDKYNSIELQIKFKLDSELTKSLIDRKVICKDEKNTYSFKFVGILIINDRVIFCLPKYIKVSDNAKTAKQILALFKEYSRREKLDAEELETIGNIESLVAYNLLSTIIFMLTDYFENGLYSNEKNIYVLNGEDEVNWLKTINEVQPIISDGEPIYLEYYTNSTQSDEENYFRQLHRYVLDLCSKKLSKLGLSDFLGFETINFDVDDDGLGTPQIMVSKIYNELNIQFVSRKQLLLKAMAAFIANEKMDAENATISFYGTRTFHTVWEKTCGYILSNRYEDIKKYIAHPKWKTVNGVIYDAETLIPDIISITKNTFVISDAKYYNITLDDDRKLSGNPGVEDVTKQYLYQLAFDEYIKARNFTKVKNMLLFPTEEERMLKLGDVTIKFLKKLELEDITLFKLPASRVFDLYIGNRKADLNRFLDCEI